MLASLEREPRGSRIADRRLRNLPMCAGLAPISAYRTLDLPAVGSLTALLLGLAQRCRGSSLRFLRRFAPREVRCA